MANNGNIGIVKTETGIEVYKHDIYAALDDYIVSRNIEDMAKESQNKWNACLLYIHDIVFNDRSKLLTSNYDYNKSLNNNNGSNNNAYDLDLINNICNIYIDICYEYEKEISLMGFSKLTGISMDCFYQWFNGNTRLNSSGSEIYKKLIQEREESLSNRLYSNRGNPVGILGILNRHYGWNMGQPRGTQEQKTQSLDDIARRYGISQDDKQDTPQITDQDAPPEADF